MLQHGMPPGYQRQEPIKRPELGPWVSVIDTILEDDTRRPAEQRYAAKRIFERLKEVHSFTGG
jgi:transposase